MSKYLSLCSLVACLFLHAPAYAAIAEVGSSTSCNSGNNAGVTDQTCAHDAGTGANRITVIPFALRGGSVSAVTYGGVAATPLVLHSHTGIGISCEIYYLVNPPTGTNDIFVDIVGTVRIVVGGITFSGVNLASPFSDSDALQGDQVTSITATLTTATGNVLVDIASMARSDEGSFVAGANQTEEWANVTTTTAASNVRAAGSTQAGADGGVMSWSWSTAADVTLCAGNLVPAVEAGGDALQPILQ